MLYLPFESHTGTSDNYLRKNFTYTHESRELTHASGGSSGSSSEGGATGDQSSTATSGGIGDWFNNDDASEVGGLETFGNTLSLNALDEAGVPRGALIAAIATGSTIRLNAVSSFMVVTVTTSGPTTQSGNTYDIPLTAAITLTESETYIFTVTPPGGGGSGTTLTLTTGAGSNLVGLLNEIARGDYVEIN